MSTTLPAEHRTRRSPGDATTPDVPAALRELRALLPGQVVVAGDPDWDLHRLGWVAQRRPAAARRRHRPQTRRTWSPPSATPARTGLTVAASRAGTAPRPRIDDTILLRTRGLGRHRGRHRRPRRAGRRRREVGRAARRPDGTGLIAPGRQQRRHDRRRPVAGRRPELVRPRLRPRRGQHRRRSRSSTRPASAAGHRGVGPRAVLGGPRRRRRLRASSPRSRSRLHPAAHVYGGRLMWPIETAPEVLRAFRDADRDRARTSSRLWTHLLRFPPLDEIPEPLRGGLVRHGRRDLPRARPRTPRRCSRRCARSRRRCSTRWAPSPLSELGDIWPSRSTRCRRWSARAADRR